MLRFLAKCTWLTMGPLLLAVFHPDPVFGGGYVLFEGMLPGPTGMTQLQRPSSVSVNPESEEVCVTDDGTTSLHVYNSHNVYIFGTDGVAGITSPKHGVIDSRGGFVITDGAESIGRTLKRLNFYGEPLPYTPELPIDQWFPVHVLITRNGDFVSVDDHNGLITRHHGESGALLWTHELSSNLPDQGALLGQPAEAPNGNIYVPGGGLSAVLVISAEGESLGSFGRHGTGKGAFAFPVGVAFGPESVIMVLDRMRHNVLLFDLDHKFIGEFGKPGSEPGSFYHPAAIAALPDGRFWVAQGYDGRVQAFRLFESDNGNPRVRRISS